MPPSPRFIQHSAQKVSMELGRDRTVKQIVSRLEATGVTGAVKVEGTWGSFARLLAAFLSKNFAFPR